ncbi:MAG: RIP metalloprotease RseP [Thiohalospira sp.]
MTGFLFTLAAFAVAIAILVAVHEYGHFQVARWSGVRVLRFSIGMGRPVLRRQGRDGTEYVLAALPIGGYVKMLDEREGEVAEEESHRAFNRQPLNRRFAIVAAGPVANFLFAIAAYAVMLMIGVGGLQSTIEHVAADSPAAEAELRAGDRLVSIDGRETPTWNSAVQALLPAALDGRTVPVTVDRGGTPVTTELSVPRMVDTAEGGGDLGGWVGLRPERPAIPPVLGEIVAGSPAAEAGLRAGDRILAIDGRAIADWRALVEVVRSRPGESMRVAFERDGERREIALRPERIEGADGTTHGRMGAAVEPPGRLPDEYRAVLRQGPVSAFIDGGARTWETATMTLKMLGRMVTGQASLENLSGPITIAQYAGHTAGGGLVQFLAFLAVVSISLGIINLLPVPLLDGGHLMYYCVEFVKGSPVSERTEAIGQQIGIPAIIGLMTLAFYNDLARLFQ